MLNKRVDSNIGATTRGNRIKIYDVQENHFNGIVSKRMALEYKENRKKNTQRLKNKAADKFVEVVDGRES